MDAFQNAGIIILNDDTIKEHVTRIVKDEDSFEHYFYKYGTDEQKRIISIEKDPKFPSMGDVLNTDYCYKLEATWRYY
jgi:hypothetical protein